MLNIHNESAWESVRNESPEVRESFPGWRGSFQEVGGGVIRPLKNTDEDFEDEDFLDDEDEDFDDELDDEAEADIDEFEDEDDAEDVDLDEEEEL